jgi:hypothetical protein
MRDDLLEAEASVQWAEAQMGMVQAAFLEWQRSNPYKIVPERDAETGHDLAVAIRRVTFPLTVTAGVGSVINSCRTSLDLLAATLARRNGVKPTSKHHFPVRKLEGEFVNIMQDIEGKGWLTAPEIQKIKALKPYKGGDDAIWPMHALDILRKHERLVSASADIRAFQMLGSRNVAVGGESIIKRLEDKTVLCRMPPEEVRRLTHGNTLLVVDILLNESAIGLTDEPARPTLSRFARRAREVIALFDTA